MTTVQVIIPAADTAPEFTLCAAGLPETWRIHSQDNWIFEKDWEPGSDLLLLDPLTRVTPGSLEELQAVLYLHEKHAFVTPNFSAWRPRVSPRYRVVPSVGQFCILIKSDILSRFGFIHEIAAINKYGYSALVANRAQAYHPNAGETKIDSLRYPLDPLERFATLQEPHRPRILYDLYHLLPQHSGTSDFALNLLRDLEPLISDEYDLLVGAGIEQDFFWSELRGYRLYDERSTLPMVFDLVYKPCSMFSWSEYIKMTRLAPRVTFTLLDIIALRCDYIGRAGLPELFRKTVELSDLVVAISESTRSDFEAFFEVELPMPVIYLGSSAGLAKGLNPAGEYLLVMGNSYAHKGLQETVEQLGTTWPTKVVGGGSLTSGNLSRRFMHELMLKAKLLIYPSFYEGFGLPVVDALAMGKPVVVLDSALNRELAKFTGDPNLHRIASFKDLRGTVQHLWQQPPHPARRSKTWSEVAAEYAHAFRELLNRNIDVERMRRRWDTVRLVETLGSS